MKIISLKRKDDQMKNRISFLFVVTLLLFAGITGCYKNDYGTNSYSNPNTGNTGTPGANEVFIQNISFTPKSITVNASTTIKWTNKDNVAHTVTSGIPGTPNGTFDSGNLSNSATFSFMFNTKGTFQYYCKLHQDVMTGTVVVQ
jgi:plastocyanin